MYSLPSVGTALTCRMCTTWAPRCDTRAMPSPTSAALAQVAREVEAKTIRMVDGAR